MKRVLRCSAAIALMIAVQAVPTYAQQSCDPSRVGRWANNANGVNQGAMVCVDSSGTTHIGITLQGGNDGSVGSPTIAGNRIVENPRGPSTWGLRPVSTPSFSTDSSRPAMPPAFDGTNGENTFLTGPVSTETLPDGTVVQFGGMAIGGWTMDTPGTPGRTTAFAPVGPVPHIDSWALAVSAEHEAPPPPVTVRANPDPGVVAVPSWFWVAGYDGSPVTHSKTQHASHTECRLLAGVPECHTVDDSVTVNVRLTPTSYTWNFGDGRTGSVQSYPPDRGLGTAYTDATHASPVVWSYEFDSRDFSSGFPIKLTIAFSGAFQANGGSWQSLPPIDDNWSTGLVMRQVQTLNTVPANLAGSQH